MPENDRRDGGFDPRCNAIADGREADLLLEDGTVVEIDSGAFHDNPQAAADDARTWPASRRVERPPSSSMTTRRWSARPTKARGHRVRMSRMKPFLPLALVTLAIAAPTADAAVYKVTSATHTSTSTKQEEGYTGTSTATWKLARPSREASNQLQVSYGPGYGVSGLARVNVTGTYGVDITTDWKNGRCAWSTATGDTSDHGSQAPGPFELVVGPDPNDPKRTVVGHTGRAASLSNAYLGTECSTGISGEPDHDDSQLKSIPLNTFKKKKTVTLTFAGATNVAGIAYSWKTKIVLKRSKR